jgi:hypothetical protein
MMFCRSLELGLPLRGSLAVGPALFNRHSSTYLGTPLIEAARLEKKQRWLGVSLCQSFFQEPCNRLYPEFMIPYSEHLKEEEERRKPYVVLDWPRYWRNEKTSSEIKAIVKALEDTEHRDCYFNTLAFVDHSEKHQSWFKHHINIPSPK